MLEIHIVVTEEKAKMKINGERIDINDLTTAIGRIEVVKTILIEQLRRIPADTQIEDIGDIVKRDEL